MFVPDRRLWRRSGEENLKRRRLSVLAFLRTPVAMVVAFVGCCHPKGDPDGSVGFSFTEREIPEHCKSTKGVPVYLTHKHHLGPVGRVAKAWQENGKMLVAGVIYDSTPAGKEASKGLLSGALRGLSLGVIHGIMKNNSGKCTSILWREIVDVSVCEEGDLPGTLIMTVAAKEAVEKVISESHSPYAAFYAPLKQDTTTTPTKGWEGTGFAREGNPPQGVCPVASRFCSPPTY